MAGGNLSLGIAAHGIINTEGNGMSQQGMVFYREAHFLNEVIDNDSDYRESVYCQE